MRNEELFRVIAYSSVPADVSVIDRKNLPVMNSDVFLDENRTFEE